MNRPNITPEQAQAFIKASKTSIELSIRKLIDAGRIGKDEGERYLLTATAQHYDPVMVLAIRGYYKDSMGKVGENDRGIYDDAFVLIGPSYFKTFNGNTDPRIVKQGVGQLLPGWHLFKQGLHGYAHGPYKAFRTANVREVLPVIRDGEKGIKEGVTVNLHKGGQFSTNSIACQTVIADEWLEFQRDAYKLMDQEGQKVLPYLLIEE
jgi:lysozyme